MRHIRLRTRFIERGAKRRQLLALYLATQVKPPPSLILHRRSEPAKRPHLPPPYTAAHRRRKRRRDQALLAFIHAPPQTSTVPNVTGLSVAQAIQALTAAQLTETESFNQSLTVPANVILSQAPAAGTVVPLGSSVALVISLGASIVPGVVGDTLTVAVAAVVAAGLVPATAQQPTNASPPGTVLAQLPGAGSAALAGSVVSLIVAVAPAGPQGPALPAAAPLALQRGLLQDVWEYWSGDLTTGNTGDLALVSGTLRGQQRVLRRLLTNPGDYIWHPDYGAGLPGQIGQPIDIGRIKAIIRAGLALEDVVAKNPPAEITVTQLDSDVTGFSVTINYVDATTNADTVLSFNVSV